MPIAVSNPNIDAYRFGGIVAVIVGSLVLLWLARKVLAGRGKGLTSETKAILVGAFLINGARFAPWASVSFRHAHVLLWGDAFDTQALILLALGIYVSVILSQLWDAAIVRIAFIGASLAAGVAAGLVAWQFLSSSQFETMQAFTAHGVGAFAQELRIPLDRAQELAASLSGKGVLHTSSEFGAYVLPAGAVLVVAGSLFNLLYGVAKLFRRPTVGRFAAPSHAEDGPLRRRGGPTRRGRASQGASIRGGSRRRPTTHGFPTGPGHSKRDLQRSPVGARPAVRTSPAGAAPADLPPPPPMPVGPAPEPQRPRSSLGGRWAG